jgi:hypothetical protein
MSKSGALPVFQPFRCGQPGSPGRPDLKKKAALAPSIEETRAIAEEGFIYGLPIVSMGGFASWVADDYEARQEAGTERLAVGEQALRQRLREHGLLASIDEGRQMLQIRRTLEGRPRQVLHLKCGDLQGPVAEFNGERSAKPARDGPDR